ncbi:fumarylacetoacetate hydrolase family protein [Rhodanobacter denitrificans]|uniref:fumarylacetoacetate hydrolase family protein n=1 Tax=Rhodanobacter denitrificans TaxID=666685 RepID=UPI000260DDAF|nr:fumarylacetoacetate hydrolase family protein [Rhodanobacter denitrificans]EIM00648.1 fumarylacetoacetate (FAA) hydrolase [Rhodanobacter denitrificans]UJM90070.1 fumarylacetoacetate hydrolase family protein [Rhodanobacter denitrificans]
MKLGSLKEGGRDGTLVVVSRDLSRAVKANGIAPTLQAALDDWSNAAPRLNALSDELNAGRAAGVFALDMAMLASPLPRAYEFVDGSAYLPHVERVRRARGAEVPASFYTDPLMYQATSAGFLGPRDPVVVPSEDYGIDLEAEVVVVTDDVPMAVTPAEASAHIQLVGLVNDVSLRGLIPGELAKGFGFLQSKPRSALSPVVATPDELGEAWAGDKLHLPMRTWLNGAWFGEAECGVDMQFSFAELVAHVAKTRPLTAGTIVGSGTIANQDTGKGASCLAEQRTVETLRDGQPSTPFLKFGDRLKIDVTDATGASIFGAIEQQVEPYRR